MNRNELFQQQKTILDLERAKRLQDARTESHANGKEPFELRIMDELWRDNPDMRAIAQGLEVSQKNRIADWSEVYYVAHPEIQTMKEFVAKMKVLQAHGCFD